MGNPADKPWPSAPEQAEYVAHWELEWREYFTDTYPPFGNRPAPVFEADGRTQTEESAQLLAKFLDDEAEYRRQGQLCRERFSAPFVKMPAGWEDWPWTEEFNSIEQLCKYLETQLTELRELGVGDHHPHFKATALGKAQAAWRNAWRVLWELKIDEPPERGDDPIDELAAERKLADLIVQLRRNGRGARTPQSATGETALDVRGINKIINLAFEEREAVCSALRADQNSVDLQARIADWKNGGQGFFPDGETTRLLERLRPSVGLGQFQVAFQEANGAVLKSNIAQFLLPKLEALSTAHTNLINEARQAYKRSSSTLETLDAHCRAHQPLIDLVQQYDCPPPETAIGDATSQPPNSNPTASDAGGSDDLSSTSSEVERPRADRHPSWNRGKKELRFGDRLVKKFRHTSKNQFLVLEAFEEQGWRMAIDDPLPRGGKKEVDAVTRVQETTKSLNDNMAPDSPIRFSTNGSGTGFAWALLK